MAEAMGYDTATDASEQSPFWQSFLFSVVILCGQTIKQFLNCADFMLTRQLPMYCCNAEYIRIILFRLSGVI